MFEGSYFCGLLTNLIGELSIESTYMGDYTGFILAYLVLRPQFSGCAKVTLSLLIAPPKFLICSLYIS
jgi:hypothetical protein